MTILPFIIYGIFLLLAVSIALFNWMYGNQIYHIERYLKIYLPLAAQRVVRANRVVSWLILLATLFFAALRLLVY